MTLDRHRGARRMRLLLVPLLLALATGCQWFPGPDRDLERIARATPVMGEGRCPPEVLADLLLRRNPALGMERAWEVARIYIAEAAAEGVNHDLAFAQMAHETAWLAFGGVVDPGQHNYAGIGATSDSVSGAVFPDAQTGIRAHIQHLKAYGDTTALRNPLVDPRFHLVRRGSAATLDGLTRRWATDTRYHIKIAAILKRMCPPPRPER